MFYMVPMAAYRAILLKKLLFLYNAHVHTSSGGKGEGGGGRRDRTDAPLSVQEESGNPEVGRRGEVL